jgi:hypothetical protein
VDYYGVVGAITGKWIVEGTAISDYNGKRTNISEIITNIDELRVASSK